MGSSSSPRSGSSGSTRRPHKSVQLNTHASVGGSSGRSRSVAYSSGASSRGTLDFDARPARSSASVKNSRSTRKSAGNSIADASGRRKSIKAKENSRTAAKSQRAQRKEAKAQRKANKAEFPAAELDITALEDAGACVPTGADSSVKGRRKSVGSKGKYSARLHHGGDAPTGTDDLQVSESVRRKRNRSMDDMAAGRGRRVGDIRAAERARRQRAQYRKYVIKIAAAIVAVLVVVFGCIFIYRSDLLAVENVTVSGVSHLTDQEVTQLAAVPDDSTLLRLDSDGIAQRLCEHPWVQSVHVVRKFPNTVELNVTERQAGAAVKISSKSIWVISTDGVWLSAATKADWKNSRRIVGVNETAANPVAGAECTDEGILNALKVYDSLSSTLLDQVKQISAESSVKTTLTLKSGVTVAFGDASDLELKEADINALLQEHEGKISYINVRVPDRPTYRGDEG